MVRPRGYRYRQRATPHQGVRARSLVLFVAFLPTLLFLGHPLSTEPPMAGAPTAPLSRASGDGEEHARHCHTDLGGCADQPVTTLGAGELLVASLSKPADLLTTVALDGADSLMLVNDFTALVDPPPKSIA